MENRKDAPATALVVSNTPAPASSGPASGGAGGSSKPPNNRRTKRGGGGKGSSRGGSSGHGPRTPAGPQQHQQAAGTQQQQPAAGSQPWPSFYNPWMGSIQMWPGGPRPPLAPIPVPPRLQAQQQAQ
jgi:hypothetical protein